MSHERKEEEVLPPHVDRRLLYGYRPTTFSFLPIWQDKLDKAVDAVVNNRSSFEFHDEFVRAFCTRHYGDKGELQRYSPKNCLFNLNLILEKGYGLVVRWDSMTARWVRHSVWLDPEKQSIRNFEQEKWKNLDGVWSFPTESQWEEMYRAAHPVRQQRPVRPVSPLWDPDMDFAFGNTPTKPRQQNLVPDDGFGEIQDLWLANQDAMKTGVYELPESSVSNCFQTPGDVADPLSQRRLEWQSNAQKATEAVDKLAKRMQSREPSLLEELERLQNVPKQTPSPQHESTSEHESPAREFEQASESALAGTGVSSLQSTGSSRENPDQDQQGPGKPPAEDETSGHEQGHARHDIDAQFDNGSDDAAIGGNDDDIDNDSLFNDSPEPENFAAGMSAAGVVEDLEVRPLTSTQDGKRPRELEDDGRDAEETEGRASKRAKGDPIANATNSPTNAPQLDQLRSSQEPALLSSVPSRTEHGDGLTHESAATQRTSSDVAPGTVFQMPGLHRDSRNDKGKQPVRPQPFEPPPRSIPPSPAPTSQSMLPPPAPSALQPQQGSGPRLNITSTPTISTGLSQPQSQPVLPPPMQGQGRQGNAYSRDQHPQPASRPVTNPQSRNEVIDITGDDPNARFHGQSGAEPGSGGLPNGGLDLAKISPNPPLPPAITTQSSEATAFWTMINQLVERDRRASSKYEGFKAIPPPVVKTADHTRPETDSHRMKCAELLVRSMIRSRPGKIDDSQKKAAKSISDSLRDSPATFIPRCELLAWELVQDITKATLSDGDKAFLFRFSQTCRILVEHKAMVAHLLFKLDAITRQFVNEVPEIFAALPQTNNNTAAAAAAANAPSAKLRESGKAAPPVQQSETASATLSQPSRPQHAPQQTASSASSSVQQSASQGTKRARPFNNGSPDAERASQRRRVESNLPGSGQVGAFSGPSAQHGPASQPAHSLSTTAVSYPPVTVDKILPSQPRAALATPNRAYSRQTQRTRSQAQAASSVVSRAPHELSDVERAHSEAQQQIAGQHRQFHDQGQPGPSTQIYRDQEQLLQNQQGRTQPFHPQSQQQLQGNTTMPTIFENDQASMSQQQYAGSNGYDHTQYQYSPDPPPPAGPNGYQDTQYQYSAAPPPPAGPNGYQDTQYQYSPAPPPPACPNGYQDTQYQYSPAPPPPAGSNGHQHTQYQYTPAPPPPADVPFMPPDLGYQGPSVGGLQQNAPFYQNPPNMQQNFNPAANMNTTGHNIGYSPVVDQAMETDIQPNHAPNQNVGWNDPQAQHLRARQALAEQNQQRGQPQSFVPQTGMNTPSTPSYAAPQATQPYPAHAAGFNQAPPMSSEQTQQASFNSYQQQQMTQHPAQDPQGPPLYASPQVPLQHPQPQAMKRLAKMTPHEDSPNGFRVAEHNLRRTTSRNSRPATASSQAAGPSTHPTRGRKTPRQTRPTGQ